MIYFNNLSKKKLDTSILKKLGKQILKEEGISREEHINCVFINNRHIKQLNRKYKGINSPTDVLAFSFTKGEGSEYRRDMFGDIFISVEMAVDNAERFNQCFTEELKLLFVHGMLHLLGYNDESKKDKEKMRSKENHFLTK